VWGAPPAHDPPQAPVSVAPKAPAVPPTPPAGLDDRVRQATAQAAESGADIEAAILDRTTGHFASSGFNQAFPIASVVKLFIADDLLLRASQGETELSDADRKAMDAMPAFLR